MIQRAMPDSIALSLIPSVFSPGSHTAPDMPLLFVDLQDLPNLFVQVSVIPLQALSKVFVNGGF